MTRAQLLDLAARVERAEGTDRALDAEIVWRITPGITGIERGPLDDEGTDYLFEWWPRRPWTASWLDVPAYTASLDAAASLVPEGWRFLVDNLNSAGPLALCEHWPEKGVSLPYQRGTAATPALALTAAALRARAEEAPHE